MDLFSTFFNTEVMLRALPMLVRGLGNTLLLGVTAIAFGGVGGVLLALLRLYAPLPFRLLAVAFIDVFRALPVLVVLILIYYALPFVGIRFSAFTSATMGLSIVLAAFTAEIVRAGIEGVPKGQLEAAISLGLPFPMALWKVILPQALRAVVPPLTSNGISVFKDTALASVVAMPDLLKQANDAQALMANPSPLIAAAGIYLVLLLPMVRLVSWLEARGRTSR